MDRLYSLVPECLFVVCVCQWTFFFFFLHGLGVYVFTCQTHTALEVVSYPQFPQDFCYLARPALLPFDLQIQYLSNKAKPPCRSAAETILLHLWQIFNNILSGYGLSAMASVWCPFSTGEGYLFLLLFFYLLPFILFTCHFASLSDLCCL